MDDALNHARSLIGRRRMIAGASAVFAFPHRLGATMLGEAAAEPGPTSTMALELARFICDLRYEDIDPRAIERAKEHLIYHVGLAFSGALSGQGRQALAIVERLGGARGSCTIIGRKGTASMLDACFANSTFIRALGFDDVLFPSATHAGLLTYPAALAVAEEERASGKALLTAIVAGYEVLGKLVVEEAPGRVPRRPSMPFGPFAGATAAAKLMRLSVEQTANAIGYAADGAMGLKEGHEQQPTHIYGLISRTAITAALLARAGGETAPTILEGKYGYYATLFGSVPDTRSVTARLGRDWEILRATQKRYPGTAMNIVPIQLLLEMVERHRLSAATVKSVEIELPEDRRTFDDSISTGPFPTKTQAASSVAFQTAIILLDGRIDFARYERPDAPDVLDVVRKVRITLAPHSNSRYARVRLVTDRNAVHEREAQDYVFPPIDGQTWIEKDGLAFVSRDALSRFNRLTRRLEDLADARELGACLRPA